MKVLVAGASGFVGHGLCPALSAARPSVAAGDLRPSDPVVAACRLRAARGGIPVATCRSFRHLGGSGRVGASGAFYGLRGWPGTFRCSIRSSVAFCATRTKAQRP